MNVLFLSSHPLGRQALAYLESCDGWDNIDVKITGELDPYPDDYQLGISFLYNHLIPADQLQNHTWINFHPAPLPKYRGRNVAYHAIMNGETWFGATLHYVDATFDTGDLIEVFPFEFLMCDTAGDIAEQARQICLGLFKKWIPRFLVGEKPKGVPQTGGTYYKKRPIDPYVRTDDDTIKQIRAITAPPHYPKILIGGIEYVIHPASECYHPDDESSDAAQKHIDRTV